MKHESAGLSQEERSESRYIIEEMLGLRPPKKWMAHDEEDAPDVRPGPGVVKYHYNIRMSIRDPSSAYRYWMVHDGVKGALLVVWEDGNMGCVCSPDEEECAEDCATCEDPDEVDALDYIKPVVLRYHASLATVAEWDRMDAIEVDEDITEDGKVVAAKLIEDMLECDYAPHGVWLGLLSHLIVAKTESERRAREKGTARGRG